MNLSKIRRITARVLKVGKSRIWIDPHRAEELTRAITRKEMIKFIEEGAIRVLPKQGVSRGRHRMIKKRKGPGKRKGARRVSKKESWITRIRSLRRCLRMLRGKGKISRRTYRRLYQMAKGGVFKSKAHLIRYIREQYKQ